MKVIGYGSRYEIYEDDLKTYDKLPAMTYIVNFHPMQGFSLVKSADFENKEGKIYGNHMQKIDKIMRGYDSMNRSLGIILSGDKGIGKSLFNQLLSERVIERDIPVIIVNKAYNGIASFLDSIEQEVLVLFDEFEKVFDEDKEGVESQDSLLGLFDGMSQQKRIYAITVNKLNRVNEFMINRPGRFHYHLRFEYPSAAEITEYLEDKVPEEYHSEIPRVVAFGTRIKLNYDCLRAVAFELSLGETFEEAIKDLNIINTQDYRYDVELNFKGNVKPIKYNMELDLFQDVHSRIIRPANGDYVHLSFNAEDIITQDDTSFVPGDKIELYLDEDNDVYKDVEATSFVIKPQKMTNVHFSVV